MRWFLLIFLFSAYAHSQAISIGQFNLGGNPVEFDLNDFTTHNKNKNIKAQLNFESLRWERTKDNLLLPFILLDIDIQSNQSQIILKKENRIYYPAKTRTGWKTSLEVNLMSPTSIYIYENAQQIDELKIFAQTSSDSELRKWIDYSCKPYQVTLKGLDYDYTSIGCKMHTKGSFGYEKPRLEVLLSSTQSVSTNNETPPFIFYFDESGEQPFQVTNTKTKKIESAQISATIPEELDRLKIAAGVGPYVFKTKDGLSSLGPQTSASFMLYGKFTFNDTSSLKAFDALILDHTFFNNSGLYYSYDLAHLLDGKITFGALLGFQGLHYQYDANKKTTFEMIFPQGFELTYLEPFNIKNKYLNYGMFVSTTSDTYKNIWLRYGSKIFYELNYIEWGKDQKSIDMWGLSIGFPLGSFL